MMIGEACPCERGFIKGRLRGLDLPILPDPLDCVTAKENMSSKEFCAETHGKATIGKNGYNSLPDLKTSLSIRTELVSLCLILTLPKRKHIKAYNKKYYETYKVAKNLVGKATNSKTALRQKKRLWLIHKLGNH